MDRRMDRRMELIDKEIKFLCKAWEKEYNLKGLYKLWADKQQKEPETLNRKLTKEEWIKLLTFSFEKYKKYKYDIPYRACLYSGNLEEWLYNCKEIQYGDKLSVVKSAFNHEYGLKLTNKSIRGKLLDLLQMLV